MLGQRLVRLRDFLKKRTLLGKLFVAISVGAPPYLINQYYQIQGFADRIRVSWPIPASILDHNVTVGVLLAGVWAFLLISIYHWVTLLVSDEPDGWQDTPLLVISELDNIVGAKEQRFEKFLSANAGTQSIESSVIFDGITQPANQISELIRGVYTLVNSLLKTQLPKGYVLKVNIATLDIGQTITSIPYHYPSDHPVRTSLESLNEPDSGIRTAARTKRVLLIESTSIELTSVSPRFVRSDTDEDGSLLCLPIVYDPWQTAVMVLSIYVDQPYAFRAKYKKKYELLLKPFVLRIKLEYVLLLLKGKSYVPQ